MHIAQPNLVVTPPPPYFNSQHATSSTTKQHATSSAPNSQTLQPMMVELPFMLHKPIPILICPFSSKRNHPIYPHKHVCLCRQKSSEFRNEMRHIHLSLSEEYNKDTQASSIIESTHCCAFYFYFHFI